MPGPIKKPSGGIVSSTVIPGSLAVEGRLIVEDEVSALGMNFLALNHAYSVAVAQDGGIVVNYLPTATVDTVAAGAFTAGVAAVSNPTIVTVGTAVFAAGDIINVDVDNNKFADAFYEVHSHVGTLLTLRGVGTVPTTVGFLANQVPAVTATGAITKITVGVFRCNTAGDWEGGKGSTTTGWAWAAIGGGLHASDHTDGTDDIQDATNAQKGLATAAQITALEANTAHSADTVNPHATDLNNLGTGILAELNAAVTDATLDDSTATRPPAAHASDHTDGTDDVADLVGDSGAGGTHGLVPAPGAGDAAAGKFLKADGTWVVAASGGDEVPHSGEVVNFGPGGDVGSLHTDWSTAYAAATAGDTMLVGPETTLTETKIEMVNANVYGIGLPRLTATSGVTDPFTVGSRRYENLYFTGPAAYNASILMIGGGSVSPYFKGCTFNTAAASPQRTVIFRSGNAASITIDGCTFHGLCSGDGLIWNSGSSNCTTTVQYSVDNTHTQSGNGNLFKASNGTHHGLARYSYFRSNVDGYELGGIGSLQFDYCHMNGYHRAMSWNGSGESLTLNKCLFAEVDDGLFIAGLNTTTGTHDLYVTDTYINPKGWVGTAAEDSGLSIHLRGSSKGAATKSTANWTANGHERHHHFDTQTTGAHTFTLAPIVQYEPGQIVRFKDYGNTGDGYCSVNAATIATNGSEKIDGDAASRLIKVSGGHLHLQVNQAGTEWVVISQSGMGVGQTIADSTTISGGVGAQTFSTTVTINEETLRVGTQLRIAFGVRTVAWNSGTYTVRLRIGGNDIVVSAAETPAGADEMFIGDAVIVTRAVPGAAVDTVGGGSINFAGGTNQPGALANGTTLATDADLVVDVQITYSADVAGNQAMLEWLTVR